MKKSILFAFMTTLLLSYSCSASSSKKRYGTQDQKWWKEAVVYQIYPRSFQDSDGDGIGDLKGITSRLPYIKKLGADVVWLNPIYKSPNDDNGFDISNYQDIMNDYGTMADFDELLATAHNLGLKIMMDLVVNHTSDEHPWFIESKKGKENPYRDFYIWRNGKGENLPPNNWLSYFSGPAWSYDKNSDQYYLHTFSKKQPELNWDNPKLRESVFNMMTWWLDKGVDGFRMDVINLISKDQNFPDDPKYARGEYGSSIDMVSNGPRVHEYIKEMNKKVLSKYNLITVGEAPGTTTEDAIKYTGFDSDELNMVFQFAHMQLDQVEGGFGKWTDSPVPLDKLKETMSIWQTDLNGKAWNSLYWDNHDQPRAVSRFGNDSPEYRTISAKMIATCLHFMQGTPYIFQGEEIGMTNVHFESISEYKDIETLNAYDDLVINRKVVSPEKMMSFIHNSSRDNARTPMQWNTNENAGFTKGKPWIKVNPNHKEINVEAALIDPNSVFYFYQKIIKLRKENPIVVYGDYTLVDKEDEDVYAYKRSLEGEELLVICNFSDKTIERKYKSLENGNVQLLVGNYPEDMGAKLRPYESKVYLIK